MRNLTVDRGLSVTADDTLNLRIAVVIPSLGRPVEVGQLIAALERQTYPPHIIILSVTEGADLPSPLPSSIEVVVGPKGSCAQRNLAISLVIDRCDVIAFFDDDYLPARSALEGIAKLFAANPDVVGADGQLLADGIGTAGLSYEEAQRIIEAFDRDGLKGKQTTFDTFGLYGCNMAFRASAIDGVRFDENLPLYGWQEDIDFASRLCARGRVIKTNAFAGVHRGVKRGRTSGLRFGYSQVINPLYLVKKRTMPARYAYKLILKNVGANHARIFWPEPWVDRWGRVRGNWWALWHALTGRIDPRLMLELS